MRVGETQNLTVVLRVRPFNEANVHGKDRIVHVLDGQMVILTDPRDEGDILRAKRSREKRYMFDIAFDSYNTQLDVYLATTKPLIDSVLQGFNATVFAYGPTGTGKTYTMSGTNDNPGIMALALNEIFALMRKGGEHSTFTVTMSYLEVYNELIRDLLCPESGDLELREDSSGVTVVGLTEVEARSTKEVMDMLRDGNKRRTTEPTSINKTSSRSHAVLQVTVKRLKRMRQLTETIHVGKLYMIDLAGSERATHTKNRGTRLVEGAHINRSLLALGNCIKALSNGGTSYVNYRDSKLTRLLKDSLGGNCRTVMIAHVTPHWRLFDESRNTLQYADRAKRIRTKIRPNLHTVSHHIAKYPIIVEELHKEIERLKKKIPDNQSIESISATMLNKDRDMLDTLREELNKIYSRQLKMKTRISKIAYGRKMSRIQVEHLSYLLSQYNDSVRKCVHSILPAAVVQFDTEPVQVSELRGTLSRMSAGRRRADNINTKLQNTWDRLSDKYRSIEEDIDDKIGDDDHKEILTMLSNIHSLELELADHAQEISALRRIGEEQTEWLRAQQSLNIDLLTIIASQRDLISGHDIPITPELETLYRGLQDKSLEQYAVLPRINSAVSSIADTEGVDDGAEEDRTSTPMFMKTYNVVRNESSNETTETGTMVGAKTIERETSQTTIHVLSTPSLTGHHSPPPVSSLHPNIHRQASGIVKQCSSMELQLPGSSHPHGKQAIKKAIQLQRLRALRTEPVVGPGPSKAKKPRNMNLNTRTYNKTSLVKSETRTKIAETSRIYVNGIARTPHDRGSKKNTNFRKQNNGPLSVSGSNRHFPVVRKVFR